MNLRQLEYFVAVAEELNFRRAASRLHIAQPSLSEQIKDLETGLQVQLFDRSVRPVGLTAAGRRLLQDAHDHLARLDQTTRAVGRASRGQDGDLRVGFIHGGLYSLLLSALTDFRQRRPHVDLILQQLSAGEQIRALRERRVDLVVARVMEPQFDHDVVVQRIRDELMMAIVPADHPLAAAGAVAIGDLANDAFVMFPRRLEPLTFDRYVRACLSAGFSPRIDHEVTDAMTQALAVAAGLGVALTGDGLALRFPGVEYLRIDPSQTITQFALLVNRETSSPLIELFCQLVREAGPDD